MNLNLNFMNLFDMEKKFIMARTIMSSVYNNMDIYHN